MTPIRRRLLLIGAGVSAVGALVFGVMAVFWIGAGAYPPPGEGSLGHVGMVVAGVGAGFFAIVALLFTVYFLLKVKGGPPREG
jgi:hypothetical protein